MLQIFSDNTHKKIASMLILSPAFKPSLETNKVQECILIESKIEDYVTQGKLSGKLKIGTQVGNCSQKEVLKMIKKNLQNVCGMKMDN